MIKRIWARLTGGRLVWVKEKSGRVRITIAYRDTWGELTADLSWPLDLCWVRLLDDGTVSASGAEKWKYADEPRAND